MVAPARSPELSVLVKALTLKKQNLDSLSEG
jgi:hypothetical protein